MSYSYTFKRFHAYTSHPGLSAETYAAIADSCYDEFPRFAIVDGKRYGLLPQEWAREPDSITKAGYAVWGGLKVKIETLYKSPDYDKNFGNGECKQQMIVRCDRPVQFVYD